MSKLIAYICAPFAADDLHSIGEHVILADGYARDAQAAGYVPFVPHTCFPVSTEEDREPILQLELDILRHFDLLWVDGDRLSSGMVGEIDEAMSRRIKIHWASADLEEEYRRCLDE